MAHIQNFEQKATIVGRETTGIVVFNMNICSINCMLNVLTTHYALASIIWEIGGIINGKYKYI